MPCERYIIWKDTLIQDGSDTLNLGCGHGVTWKPTSATAGSSLKHITALTSSSLCMAFGSQCCNFREEARWQQYKTCRAAGGPSTISCDLPRKIWGTGSCSSYKHQSLQVPDLNARSWERARTLFKEDLYPFSPAKAQAIFPAGCTTEVSTQVSPPPGSDQNISVTSQFL